MTTTFLNQNYDEGEESDNDFNPGAVVGSDDEGGQEDNRNVDLSIADRAPSPSKIQTQTPKELAQKSRSQSPVALDSRAQLDDPEEEVDNGEDDEGEGEDLGDEDDDDEDDEEDEDDEDAIVGRPRKRRRRGGNQFIEEEAEVDDEDDEENEADEDDIAETGFIQDTHPDDDLGPEADQDDRRHRELDRQRQIEASQDAEATAQRLKEQYGRRTTQSMNKSAFVPQNLLMPSVDDPSIWDVKCKPGKERDVVMAVSKKVMTRMSAGRPLKICSVFERGGGSMAGRVFVEARRKVDVDEAMEGIPDCYPRTKVDLVPVKEMPDLLRIQKSEVINLGEYVRLKRGLYQGDLGVVEDVLDNGVDVLVRLVPRLSYGLDEDEGRASNGAEKRKRTPFAPTYSITNRPPQRLFNEAEAKKRHGKHLVANRGLASRSWTYKNDTYEDGFLLKTFKANVLETKNVKPVLEEVIKLKKTAADGSEAIDLERLAHTLKNDTADSNYVPGDEVEVFQGEQRGLVGRVETVDRSILRIKVTDGELAGQVVDQPVKGVRKRFMQGDHVKVIGAGRYAGEVGMVDQIQDDKVSIITDTSQMTITVFSKDLRAAGEAGGTATNVNNLDVQDLVQIDATTVGVVIKSDMEAVRVLDQNGSVVLRLPSQLQKIEPGRHVAVATDKAGTEIRVGDGVKEAIGENKTGTILHIHRGFVFVHERTRVENSGLWVARCTGVITTMSKGREQQTKVDLSALAPHLRQQNGAAAAAMAPPQRPGRDRIIGQHVHIRKGMYKGHKGLVKDATATTARVELQSKNKTINVPKQDLSIVDRNSGKTTSYADFTNSRVPFPIRSGSGSAPSRVPDGSFAGGRTPLQFGDSAGGRTPAWGSSARTPAWTGGGGGDSSKTPAWRPSNGAATSYGGAGNMTSYGGAGSYGTAGGKTPTWSSTARTPYGAGEAYGSGVSGYDAFAAGAKTPYGSNPASSRTPAWGAVSAPTPSARAYDAPTPAVGAPTPGGFDNTDGYTSYGAAAPTPGAGFAAVDAPTPGFARGANTMPLANNRLAAATPAVSAATPYGGGYDAPTPAASGPRYAEDDDD